MQKLPPLLENHFFTRIAAMIVLSQTASPDAVDIFVKQLANPTQTVWVDLWAARGLTNIQQMGANKYSLGTPQAITASQGCCRLPRAREGPAVAGPVSRRRSAGGAAAGGHDPIPQKGQPEMATTATKFLTDPDGRIEVRAEAGWAMGMLQVPAGIAGYNFPMIGYTVGEIAAILGERIHDVHPSNVNQAELYTGMLITQIYQAFEGIAEARESGLLKTPHPAARQASTMLKQVSDKIKPVSAAAREAGARAGGAGGGEPEGPGDQDRGLAGLAREESAGQPSLVPGGPAFPMPAQQVAKGPAGKNK